MGCVVLPALFQDANDDLLKVCELSLKPKAKNSLWIPTGRPLNWRYIRESPPRMQSSPTILTSLYFPLLLGLPTSLLSADTPWVDVRNRRFFLGTGQNTRIPKNLNGLTGCGQR